MKWRTNLLISSEQRRRKFLRLAEGDKIITRKVQININQVLMGNVNTLDVKLKEID